MASNSSIEWTDASWNCLAGCEAISPGCAHCYAATMTRRLEAMGQWDYAGLTTKKHFNGTVRPLPDKLTIPLKWQKPRRVFVNSMSDLFHEDVPDDFIDRVFAVMALCPHHSFQVLTKRAERMASYTARCPERLADVAIKFSLQQFGPVIQTQFYGDKGWLRDNEPTIREQFKVWPLPNVWLGVSCEDQQRKSRIDILRQVPAAVRFLSLEPLLEDLGALNLDGIGWVIVGGESGPGARPCDVAWIRSIRDQCAAASVSCFIKQLGAKPVNGYGEQLRYQDRKGGDIESWPADLRVRQLPEVPHG